MASNERIYGLDLTRSAAILMAIIVHSINAYDAGIYMHYVPTEILFRTATPTFIIVFGVFLELVYANAMKKYGVSYATKKLLSRAIQCYVLYVISCIILAFAEGYSAAYTLRMALLMGATPYTDILKFYSFMLLLAPYLLLVKSRKGLIPLIVFCVLVHVIHALYYPIPYPSLFRGSDVVFGFLYGATTVTAGPSMLHGLTFIVFGIWIGQVVRNNKERPFLLDRKKPEVIVALCACLVIVAVGWMNYEGNFLSTLGTMVFRNSNSYIYFAFGIAGAIVIMDACLRITHKLGASKIKPVLFLGETSLFVFCFGNCLLYITRRDDLEPNIAICFTLAVISANIAMAWGYNKFRSHVTSMDPTLPSVKVYLFMVKGYADYLAGKLVNSRLARWMYS